MDIDEPTASCEIPCTTQQISCPRLPPQEISNLQPLSKGFFGTVYSGIWSGPNVVKKIALKQVGAPNGREEYILSLLLGHTSPGLITFLGTTDNHINDVAVHYLVSDLIEGDTLANFLYPVPEATRFPALDPPAKQALLINVLLSIASGLAFLHSCSPPIYHLDVSSSNILISSSLIEAKLCDFGHSDFDHVLRTDRPWNRLYGAPELWIPGMSTSKADLFSFGLILWECFISGMTPIDHVSTEYPVGDGNDALLQWRLNLDRANRPYIARVPDDAIFHNRIKNIVVRSWVHNPLNRNLTLDVVHTLLKSITSTTFEFPEGYHFINDTHDGMTPLKLGQEDGIYVDPYGDQIVSPDLPTQPFKRRKSFG